MQQLNTNQAEVQELRADAAQLRAELQQRRRAAQQHGAVTDALEQQLASSKQEVQALKQQVEGLNASLEKARSQPAPMPSVDHGAPPAPPAANNSQQQPTQAPLAPQQQQELEHLRQEVHTLRGELLKARSSHRELSVALAARQDELAERSAQLNKCVRAWVPARLPACLRTRVWPQLCAHS